MASDANTLMLSGRLAFDPKYENKGSFQLCRLRIASDYEVVNRKEGTSRIETTFVDVTLWNKEATIAQRLKKGMQIAIEGRLKQEEWEDKETKEKKTKYVAVAHKIYHNYKLDDQVHIEEEEDVYMAPVRRQESVEPKPQMRQKEAAPKIQQAPSVDPNYGEYEEVF